MQFHDRIEAGKVLGQLLAHHRGRPDVLVLGLPRGGVPVAFEVAEALGAPLDVFVVRKLGVPGHEELAMGAIASGGVRVLNREVIEALGISQEHIERVAAVEGRELERRERDYRAGRPTPTVQDRTVIIIDDGLATGSTMHAAVAAIRALEAKRIVVAVPVAPPDTCAALRREADEMICAETPEHFRAVGLHYRDFSPTTDDEVRALLARAAYRGTSPDTTRHFGGF